LPRALVTHSGELTFRQQLWVGWAYTYPDGVISCHSAAAVDDLKGFGSATVHITVPQGKKPSPQPGLRLHESRHLGGNDVHPIKRPTRMRIERSLVGIAAHAKRVDGAIAALAAGVQQQLTTAPLLAETLRRLPTTKWRGELLAVCADLAGGSHSVIEVEAMRVFRKYRLPLPDRQVPMTLPDGLARVDCYWSSRGVVAELDGRMHMDVAQWVADLDRQNELSLESNLVLRYPLWALRFRPEHVAGQLRRALGDQSAEIMELPVSAHG